MHVQLVVRQFVTTFRLHARKVAPVSPSQAAAISAMQTCPLHGRVAVATEASTPSPRTEAAKAPTILPRVIIFPFVSFMREIAFAPRPPRDYRNNRDRHPALHSCPSIPSVRESGPNGSVRGSRGDPRVVACCKVSSAR